ncbi:MAG: hypothetical protein OXR82_02360 [Gammaproteobacteria bacterium]|nr:hypothetical protein [Gammaproteobacteria bacterium]MDE0257218.1 hypothetical protein [Gammaproteobacteria bacterium]
MALLAVGACDWFDDESPDTATLILQGSGEVQAPVVVSREFTPVMRGPGDVDIHLTRADTTLRSLPFDTVYDIRGPQRFYVLIERAEPSGAEVWMRVSIDQNEHYNELRAPAETPHLFIYAFNQPHLLDLERRRQ